MRHILPAILGLLLFAACTVATPAPPPTPIPTPLPPPTPTPASEWGIAFGALMRPLEDLGEWPMRLYMIRPDGSDLTQLTGDIESLDGLKSSPDGRYILFAAKREDTLGDHYVNYFDLSHLYIIDIQTSEIFTLTSGTTTDEWFGIADWSPDGKQIAFASSEATKPCRPCPPCYEESCTPTVAEYHTHLYVINRDGTGKKRLTPQEGRIVAVAWSPSGGWIAFEQEGVIWAVRPDGSGLHKIADAPVEYWMPYHIYPLAPHLAWSPDGGRLAFAAPGVNGKADIWIAKADGSGLFNLTRDPADDFEPAWSPDGRSIAFISNRRGNWAIYIADVEGGRVREVYYDPSKLTVHPTWSPNGAQIAFIARAEWKARLFILNLSSGFSYQLSDMVVVEPFVWISMPPKSHEKGGP